LGGGAALGVPTQLGDPEAIDQLVAVTVEEFGGIDIVINNAANALALPLGEITPQAWAKSFSVNLQGPVFLVQAALPYLRKSQHAAILNMVSAGRSSFRQWSRCIRRPRPARPCPDLLTGVPELR
jgi:NAD(P)-dependent dehydrogenase (short-subunit alcohol dehydrogenase family)